LAVLRLLVPPTSQSLNPAELQAPEVLPAAPLTCWCGGMGLGLYWTECLISCQRLCAGPLRLPATKYALHTGRCI